MPSAEAGFSATFKDSKGNLLTLRGDDWSAFSKNAEDALGAVNAESFLNHFTGAFTGVESTAQAVGHVQAAFPQAAQVQPQATIGGNVVPMPTPGQVHAQPEQPPAAIGGGAPPCNHGPRVYRESQTSKGLWRRYECAIPWQKNADNSQRCKAINA